MVGSGFWSSEVGVESNVAVTPKVGFLEFGHGGRVLVSQSPRSVNIRANSSRVVGELSVTLNLCTSGVQIAICVPCF